MKAPYRNSLVYEKLKFTKQIKNPEKSFTVIPWYSIRIKRKFVLKIAHSRSRAFMFYKVFAMAAIPFPCNGILLIQGNLPRIIAMSTLRQASYPIPCFKLFLNRIRMGQLYNLTYLGGIIALPCNDIIACFFKSICHSLQWYHCLFLQKL